ncbi:uncharacterized protein LOC115742895 [Rhodamnia argentea]|uniref:Uncharacterized protein LOC115742895 n=1 Tax=Rhodamnia argentea TaxID=178133 RepID=A0A8B8PGN3_9MYRT|nr:uncharacterized protein LOC115742895 [Rhodamnia argentea]
MCLCAHGSRSVFKSKSSFRGYISSQFPNADVEELFASFIWNVPSTKQRQSEDLHPDIFAQVPPVESASKRMKEAPCTSKMTKKVRPAMSQAFPRRRMRHSYKTPAQANTGNEFVIDSCSLTDDASSNGSGYSEYGSETQIDLEESASDQSLGSRFYASKDFEAQDVDDCLKSMEHILSQPNVEAQVWTPFTYVGPDMAEEMATHRKKLSSILALDFSCLLSSECLEEISYSVEKLMADPILTVDQLLKLKSVEEIPKAREVFLRTKAIVEQATKFFEDLRAKKDKVSSLKREYSELKKEAGALQFQIESKSPTVREIDEQIAQLQARKAELACDIKSKNKAKDQVVAEQKIMANSTSAVMRDIQTAVAEIPLWEMKKKHAEKRMAEILARYAPLKGFSFEKSG